MTIEEFERLIQEAGLNLIDAYAPQFVVSLHMRTEWGTRVQGGMLTYDHAEFAALSCEACRSQIAALKKRLERAAKTKQGVLR